MCVHCTLYIYANWFAIKASEMVKWQKKSDRYLRHFSFNVATMSMMLISTMWVSMEITKYTTLHNSLTAILILCVPSPCMGFLSFNRIPTATFDRLMVQNLLYYVSPLARFFIYLVIIVVRNSPYSLQMMRTILYLVYNSVNARNTIHPTQCVL